MTKVFVPYEYCTVASGDCFTQGKCTRDCKTQRMRDQDKRITALETRVRELERAIFRATAGTRRG